jgi:membrane protein EpsK
MQIFHAGSKQEIADYIRSSMLFIAAFVALPAGFISGVAPQLLSIWLGPGFADEWTVLVALALAPATTLFFTPLITLLTASNRILEFGLVTLLTGILNIIAAILILKFSTFAGVGVALCIVVSLFLRNILYVIPRIVSMTSISFASIYLSLTLAIVWTLSAAGIAHVMVIYTQPHSFLGLIICGMLTTVVYIAVLLITLPLKFKQLLLNEGRRIGGRFGLLRT